MEKKKGSSVFMFLGAFDLIIIICSASSFNSSTDESSLLAIMSYATNSDPNNVLATNWSQRTPFCSWIGVSCSHRRVRVIGLDLSGLDLRGTISQHIGNLSFLTYIDLSNNSFNGLIPVEIGRLRRLRVLDMSSNKLNGGIPSSFGFLANLERLDLSTNFLSGTIPRNIFNLSSLKEISLFTNQLYGTLPPDICRHHHMEKLEVLFLYKNQLSGEIPAGLSACSQLRGLRLAFNNFIGSVPLLIGNLSYLQILNFGVNELTGTIPPSIGNLSNLERFDLGRNNIQGTIPSELGLLSHVTYMNLEGNKIHGEVPPSVFNLSRLQTLSLAVNQLSGNILPSSIAEGVPNLEGLYLASNQFTGNVPVSISNLSRLGVLDLGANSFSGCIPTNLGNLGQLQKLNFVMNRFTNDLSLPEQDFLSSLTNCNKINLIHFGANYLITGMLPKSFVGSTNLSSSLGTLISDSCRITGTVPIELGNMSNLVWLALGENNFRGQIPTTFGLLENLQKLTLDGNNLHGPIPISVCRLKKLYYIDFSRNNLSGELPLCLADMASLEVVHLSDNAFSSTIPSSFWFNGHLQMLDLNNNLLSGNLPQDVGNVQSMVKLFLSGNQLSGGIPRATVAQFEKLIEISLSDNNLDGPIPESFSFLKDLQYLDLSHNHLSGSIPKSFQNLTNLRYFNVSFNELIGEIPEGGPFMNFTGDVLRGNKGLCGASRFKVEKCKRSKAKSSSKLRKLLVYILPAIASIAIGVALLILFLRWRKPSSSPDHESNIPTLDFPRERISYYEILRATNNFDEGNRIGRGSIGSVYKGLFPNGMIFAIKVFDLDVQGALESFITECQILCGIRHRNLVKVITSCVNLEFKALVLKYIPNGNLDKWLHTTDGDRSLTIDQRLGTMIDVASAVEYLHHGYSAPVVHCDLKPSNILLDQDMVAHVGDFGISKLLNEEQSMKRTQTLGTVGYMAPEFGSGGMVSTATDIYSFGILLIETFTRKRPTDELFSEEFTIQRWACEAFPDNVMQIVDHDLSNIGNKILREKSERCLTSIMRKAIECTKEFPEERPNIKDVLASLTKIRIELQETT